MTRSVTKDAASKFRARLNRAWNLAGNPKAIDVEKFSQKIAEAEQRKGPGQKDPLYHRLPDSTLHDNLKGDGKRLARWGFVYSLIVTLRAMMKDQGMDPDLIGTLEEWERWYRAAMRTAEGRPALEDLAAGFSRAGWWHEYADLVPIWMQRCLDAEPSADVLRIYAPERVPEVLQTPLYAAAMIGESLPAAGPQEVAARLALRMRRQEILREADPTLLVVLEETVLTHPVGSPEVMRGQYRRLLEIGRSRRATLLVRKTPLSVPITTAEQLTLLRFGHSGQPDLGFLRQPDYGLYIDKPEDIAHFLAKFANLSLAPDPTSPTSPGTARSREESLEFIQRLLDA